MKNRRRSGRQEIRGGFADGRKLFWAIAAFSAVVNLLMLTGPIFMLQIYDRVLTSRSEATLVTLTAIVAVLFLAMGLMDHARARVLARVGARFEEKLQRRVLEATLSQAGKSAQARGRGPAGVQDVEAIQRFLSGPGPFAFFDAPWTPVFLAILFLFHWLLGTLAVGAGMMVLGLALAQQLTTANRTRTVHEKSSEAVHGTMQAWFGGETIRALGMRAAITERIAAKRHDALQSTMELSDRTGRFAVTTKTLRLFMQSMMLALGGWLAIQGVITPGVMIAATILLGRALAPVDQAVGQWPRLQRVLEARRTLARLLEDVQPEQPRPKLPEPDPEVLRETGTALFTMEEVDVAPPELEEPLIGKVSLEVQPGRVVGIIGMSGAGKSTLARIAAGIWKPLMGKITFAGAGLEQYGEDELGRKIGWLGQEAELLPGTIAENIGRFDPYAQEEGVIAAAREAGAHEMILGLPHGYGFDVASGGGALSGGQRRRIALARAMYGRPWLLILDEPGANLDADGVRALHESISALKARGGGALIIAHDPRTIFGCDEVKVVENGELKEATVVEQRRRAGRDSEHRGREGTAGTGPVAMDEEGGGKRMNTLPVKKDQGRLPVKKDQGSRMRPVQRAPQRWSARAGLVLGFATLAFLVVAVGGWSTQASIAGAVIAAGKVEPRERAYRVQHVHGGTVRNVLIRNGQRVGKRARCSYSSTTASCGQAKSCWRCDSQS